jgi:Tfp pilus assembly protein PilX
MFNKIKFWPEATCILKSQEGAVVIAALMILCLLTIIGIASTNISNTEVKIAGHELRYQQNFYRAEGATMEAVERLEISSKPVDDNDSWLCSLQEIKDDYADCIDENDQICKAFFNDVWDDNDITGPLDKQESVLSDDLEDTHLIGVYHTPGSNLDVTMAKMYHFQIFGRSAPQINGKYTSGETVIAIGYRKAF